MIYLDTGCLVKLYYPEPDSAAVAARVAGRPIFFTPLHELEVTNALSLTVFHKSAKPLQVHATLQLIRSDLTSGILLEPVVDLKAAFGVSSQLAKSHSPSIGCRSLDILHCAQALELGAAEFISTDTRQIAVAQAIGLNWSPL